MNPLDDLTVTKLCAIAIGVESHCKDGISWRTVDKWLESDWSPLNDDSVGDAQCMALQGVLLKHGWFTITPTGFDFVWLYEQCEPFVIEDDMTVPENRRRAICLCVARIQLAKETP